MWQAYCQEIYSAGCYVAGILLEMQIQVQGKGMWSSMVIALSLLLADLVACFYESYQGHDSKLVKLPRKKHGSSDEKLGMKKRKMPGKVGIKEPRLEITLF